MSSYQDYGAGAAGPEVNVRMKVDIYTEGQSPSLSCPSALISLTAVLKCSGPNEGVIFDQVVYTGAPDGFDARESPSARVFPLPQSAQ